MDKNEIVALLETVVTPIYQIEVNLGMPKTTLQKAIKGERILPKKWALKLLEVYPAKKTVNIMDLTVHSNKVEPKKPMGEKKSNFTINTNIPPMPEKMIGEDAFDYAARKNEWKLKYGQK